MDYYSILGIPRNSCNEDVYNAYRRLAQKWHPAKNPKDFTAATKMFANIAEAYEVLSQSQWRAIYDEFGETGLKNGVPGRFDLCYKFSGSSEKIYELFFGSENPYAHTIDTNGLDIPGTIFGKGKGGLTEKRPDPPKNVEVELECSLEELYNGCIKKVVYNRMVLGVDNSYLKPEKTTKEITIKKGFGAETVLEYKGEGNESPTFPSANLIIKIKELKHSLFERKGANLFYLHHVNLLEALESVPVTLYTLDNRQLLITNEEVISPATLKKVEAEGMPILNSDNKGDLYISFDIKFPEFIPEESKALLKKGLEEQEQI